MPRKKEKLSQERQSEMFRKTVQELIDAGELSPTEAQDRLEKMLMRERRHSK
jgi:hypothetical protein